MKTPLVHALLLLAINQLAIAVVGGVILTCYADIREPRPPSLIDPSLCTHVVVIGGCQLHPNGTLDPPPEETIADYVKLKERNATLKVLMTLIPGNSVMSEVVTSGELMDKMLDDVGRYLERTQLDGFDYDWEFPSWSPDTQPTDRDGFGELLKRTRAKFDSLPSRPLLFVTVAAPYTIVSVSYDAAALNTYADYVQVMNYDFHRYSKFAPLTGFNAPLHAIGVEFWILKRMNSEYSIRNWLALGVQRSKLIFGIPTYGVGFTLASPRDHRPYDPAVGVSSLLGEVFSYRNVCGLAKAESGWKHVWNADASSIYSYKGREWLSFEDTRSVVAKAKYAMQEMKLAGVMVFALHGDDYLGECGQGAYPLTRAIKNAVE